MFEKHRKLCDDSNYIQLNDINTQKGIGKKSNFGKLHFHWLLSGHVMTKRIVYKY